MDRNKIEKLVVLVVIALILQFLGSKGVYFYFLNVSDSLPNGEVSADQISQYFSALQYQEFFKNLFSVLTNFVICYWLFTNAPSRSFLWGLLGLFAKWWALPLFVYYLYASKNNEHT